VKGPVSAERHEADEHPGSPRRTDAVVAACPACHGLPLRRGPADELECGQCSARYPKRAKVDVLLTKTEWRLAVEHLAAERHLNQRYSRARRESPLNILYYDHWVALMLREIPPGNHGPLLELMCGEAEVCRRLPSWVGSAMALDLNVEMVERAAADFAAAGEHRVTVVCGTASRLPVASGSIGIVVVQGGLHHARPLLPKILAEISRVLEPGGVLVGSEPANDTWLTSRVRRFQYARSTMQGHDEDEDGFTRNELQRALTSAGLRLDGYRQSGFIAYPLMGNTDLVPMLAHIRSQWFGRSLMAVDDLLARVPVVRGLGWMSIFTVSKSGHRP
jgi:SAM-dependent methyltransferase